jgi:hypothetical protein
MDSFLRNVTTSMRSSAFFRSSMLTRKKTILLERAKRASLARQNTLRTWCGYTRLTFARPTHARTHRRNRRAWHTRAASTAVAVERRRTPQGGAEQSRRLFFIFFSIATSSARLSRT